MPRVLIVDDERQMLRALSITLRAFDYEVHTAANGVSALAAVARQPPDLVLLDLGLPDVEGTDVIRGLREWTTVPIIVLSGRADAVSKTDALDLGADDYVTKPFSMDELHARVRAALRRSSTGGETPSTHRIGDWLINLSAHTITTAPPTASSGAGTAGQTAGQLTPHLTPTEWKLLEVLVGHPGKLVDSRQLLTQVWGTGYEHATNNLRFHLSRLRAKLEPVPSRPRHLLTEPGLGYRYRP